MGFCPVGCWPFGYYSSHHLGDLLLCVDCFQVPVARVEGTGSHERMAIFSMDRSHPYMVNQLKISKLFEKEIRNLESIIFRWTMVNFGGVPTKWWGCLLKRTHWFKNRWLIYVDHLMEEFVPGLRRPRLQGAVWVPELLYSHDKLHRSNTCHTSILLDHQFKGSLSRRHRQIVMLRERCMFQHQVPQVFDLEKCDFSLWS